MWAGFFMSEVELIFVRFRNDIIYSTIHLATIEICFRVIIEVISKTLQQVFANLALSLDFGSANLAT